MKEIFCFGDSITRGEYDPVSGGWANKLVTYFFNKGLEHGIHNTHEVYALGISGETSVEALSRVEQEFLARRDKDMQSVFVFAYGANDSAFYTNEARFAVSKDTFKDALKKLVVIANKYNAETILVNITPVIEEKNKEPNHRGKVRNNQYVEEYNEIIKEVADEEGMNVVDVYSLFNQVSLDSLFIDDGLHPNSLGHEIIFDAVLFAINNLKHGQRS